MSGLQRGGGRLLLVIALLGGPACCLSAHAQAGDARYVRVRVAECLIEAPVDLERQAQDLATQVEGVLARLERRLGSRPDSSFRILLVSPASESDPEVALLEAGAPEWAAGYMLPSERIGVVRVRLASRYPYGTVESVFAHEVSHLVIHDAARGRVPRWFDEGVATREARAWGLEDVLVYSTSLLTARLPPLADLDRAFSGSEAQARQAYAAAFAFASWAERRYGPALPSDLLRAVRQRPFADAWLSVTGSTLAEDEAAWRGETLFRYRWVPILTASSTLWAAIGLLAFLGALRKRARARAARQAWSEPADTPTPGPD